MFIKFKSQEVMFGKQNVQKQSWVPESFQQIIKIFWNSQRSYNYAFSESHSTLCMYALVESQIIGTLYVFYLETRVGQA
jgi:hypothetical protein